MIFFAGALGGYLIGGWLTNLVWRRRLTGGVLEEVIREQMQVAFKAGFLTAADIVTVAGQEELAGKLRHTAEMATAANDNP